MKKVIFIGTFLLIFGLAFQSFSFAQGMMRNRRDVNSIVVENTVTSVAQKEADGRAIWNSLQNKTLGCSDLSDDNFASLGEFFMGQMMGNAHEAMNNMMTERMGGATEEQMHVTIGERLSGCNIYAAFPSQAIGNMPMTNMMSGGWMTSLALDQQGNPRGDYRYLPFGWFGLLLTILWWILIISGIIMFIRWIAGRSRHYEEKVVQGREQTPIEILNERYAKGLIDKKEFDERKAEFS